METVRAPDCLPGTSHVACERSSCDAGRVVMRGIFRISAALLAVWLPLAHGPAMAGNCLIKGNINRHGERIYHVPGSRWYSRTIITPAKGERWFCSEREAIAAGWRPPLDQPSSPQARRLMEQGAATRLLSPFHGKARRGRRGLAGGHVSPVNGCLIKGNINRRGECIYHVPGSRWYSRTIITPAKGERWFCSEREAIAAGCRAPRR